MNRIGTVYGQGLYTLAKDEGLETEILQQLLVLDESFRSQPDFLRLLALRNLPKDERIGILNDGFADKLHPYVLNFLKLLTEKGHIRAFPDCVKAYRQKFNADNGIVSVQAVADVLTLVLAIPVIIRVLKQVNLAQQRSAPTPM